MAYLLDTNILSEPPRPRPSPQVIGWLEQLPPSEAFVSVVSIGEIHRGIANIRRSDAAKAEQLETWIMGVEAWSDRILPVSLTVATIWGHLRDAHRNCDPVDALIAATAQAHGLTVATRNTRDFQAFGIPLLNPFEAP
ncbi:type II toxin-antitoxin system VapC family toxin [Azospirillum sp. B21]|uniref:type II toxin-antitoxin system VapC family toxin n=1 Tax=Azospirillum sp. B21 TaxID=2607496 RepID=UPI0011EE85C2|nr:type II toxin-antitoxin system VapC family toxin [Azospirillum sp. B21]KAA0583498.1 type II toxin-antitoxin system VapC family toxin [Azospirillum sp. B21]